jgi:hypothetical protein
MIDDRRQLIRRVAQLAELLRIDTVGELVDVVMEAQKQHTNR